MGKKLYGYVSKGNIEYEWKTEPGACEVCLGLNGTIYDSANDIPDRPHPNCKCHIEILEKESDEAVFDPIEAHRKVIKDRKRNELELAKLLGDTKSLEQVIDEYIRRINEQDKEIELLENSIDTSMLEPKDKQTISEIKDKIDYSKYQSNKTKQDISNLERDIYSLQKKMNNRNASNEEIANLMDRLRYAKDTIEEYVVKNMTQAQADMIANILSNVPGFRETTALWNLSSSKFENNKRNNDYVTKNGYVYHKIDDLHNTNLQKDIKDRLKKETGKNDCKVLVLHTESSMAKEIVGNKDFKNFLKNNIKELEQNKYIQEKNITFRSGDLYNAMHGAKVKDIKLDDNGNITLRVEDLYNFEANRTSVKGRLGEKYQNKGQIENYYIITKIEIPKSVWSKY
ncbi:unknown [Clostridium sp. CAG:306]|nr:unknown [Clostridium sp. CAG:306]